MQAIMSYFMSNRETPAGFVLVSSRVDPDDWSVILKQDLPYEFV